MGVLKGPKDVSEIKTESEKVPRLHFICKKIVSEHWKGCRDTNLINLLFAFC